MSNRIIVVFPSNESHVVYTGSVDEEDTYKQCRPIVIPIGLRYYFVTNGYINKETDIYDISSDMSGSTFGIIDESNIVHCFWCFYTVCNLDNLPRNISKIAIDDYHIKHIYIRNEQDGVYLNMKCGVCTITVDNNITNKMYILHTKPDVVAISIGCLQRFNIISETNDEIVVPLPYIAGYDIDYIPGLYKW